MVLMMDVALGAAVVTMVILDLDWAMDPETTWEVTPAACKADTLIVLVWPAATAEARVEFPGVTTLLP